MKFKKEPRSIGGVDRVYFYCPGCMAYHRSQTYDVPMSERDFLSLSLHCMNVSTVHKFDGNYESPTIEPSLGAAVAKGQVCHSYIRAGKIQCLTDSTHPLAGQTVDLPEITDDPYGEMLCYREERRLSEA